MKISKIQLLAPFNSGTHLLTRILNQNTKQKIQIRHNGHTLFWKHTINKSLISKSIKSNTDTLFICMYKPIHNWICSVQKAPYGLRWDKTLTSEVAFFEDYLDEQGEFQSNVQKTHYNNIIEIYNEYYNMYISLINTYDRVTFMNYYDILDRKNVEKYISNKLLPYNLSINSSHNIFSILDKPAKSHGISVKSSDEAIRKKDECYNNINNCKKNRLMIKKYFNHEIKQFFEKIE